jgi:hypothetical protein
MKPALCNSLSLCVTDSTQCAHGSNLHRVPGKKVPVPRPEVISENVMFLCEVGEGNDKKVGKRLGRGRSLFSDSF